ncbi:hypothetical protein P691DRAFT_425436 [Macrolepiota fuliginosa MF-IS2]|uniref:Uncharacterized protein n=1 Tax=Macrolepiota fuliginosa MF-IS2 TaxID=1400762 RepID=A0A9P5XH93_9AGAR|nr:hypothetical protein P691DRAFT_425436 [Macrolepiota fuliginosa MF-IS2]
MLERCGEGWRGSGVRIRIDIEFMSHGPQLYRHAAGCEANHGAAREDKLRTKFGSANRGSIIDGPGTAEPSEARRIIEQSTEEKYERGAPQEGSVDFQRKLNLSRQEAPASRKTFNG